MTVIVFLLFLFAIGSESINCPLGQLSCGSSACYDPTIQGCANTGGTIECIHSCNGSCYGNSQVCYNDTTVCNIGESYCDVKYNGFLQWFPLGPTCYNSSQMICYNNTLCSPFFACGNKCMNDYNSSCANNRTICYGFPYYSYYYYSGRYLNVCGPQETCYDNSTHVCLNGTTVCRGLNARFCGTNCYNPDTQTCTNGVVSCINSCNGTCYGNSQVCYNDTAICSIGESYCDVKYNGFLQWFPLGPTCYNSSKMICYNNTLCFASSACGNKCMNDYNSSCANNRTICYGFPYYSYSYSYYSGRYVNVCGPQETCYDNSTHVCLNGTTVCRGLNARFCGTNCYNPDTQTCTNGVVRCINSCNGTCYGNSQVCYNDTAICNIGESYCDVKYNGFVQWFPLGPTCYNSSKMICYNNTLCFASSACGNKCMNDYNSSCANNRTICYGFPYYSYSYSYYSGRYVNVCGPQEICYDASKSFCIDNNGTVCAIGSRLCDGKCYNPQTQNCIWSNSTVYCLSNPSSSTCSSTSTISSTSTYRSISTTTQTSLPIATSTVPPNSCCCSKNCTTNADCCRSDGSECQCSRRAPTDVYGSCTNSSIAPVCGETCPAGVQCRNNSDCCRCQCAYVLFTDPNGVWLTTRQCVKR